jgi:nitrite reductase (NADH) large subunit
VERVGLAHVKARVVDDAASRRALHDRFLFAQRFAQSDPWAERQAGDAAAPFRTLVAAE